MSLLITLVQEGMESKGPSNVYTYFQVSSTYNSIPDAEMAVEKGNHKQQ